MKTINVPLDEYDANMIQIALGRSSLMDFLGKDPDDRAVVESFKRLEVALTKAINDSW